MKQVEFYYHIPSLKEYLHSENAIITKHIDYIMSYVCKITSEDDSMTIFDRESSTKIKLWRGSVPGRFQLEIICADGIFSSQNDISLDKLNNSIEEVVCKLKKIIKLPSRYGFDVDDV